MTFNGLNIAKTNLFYFRFNVFIIFLFLRFLILELFLDEPAMVLRYTHTYMPLII